MRHTLPILAVTASLIAGAALAQTTPPPGTEHSGGPTAQAGTAAQPNANPPSDPLVRPKTKKSTSNQMMMKPKAPDPGTERSGGPTAQAGTAAQPYAAPK